MAPEIAPDFYDSLSSEVHKLRDLGKTWGLDEHQIDQCVQRALVSEETPTFSRRFRCVCFRSAIVVCSLVVCMSLFFTAVSLHKPTRLFVTKHTQKIAYPLMRGIRLMTLPIARRFDLRGKYIMESNYSNNLSLTALKSAEVFQQGLGEGQSKERNEYHFCN